MDTPLPSGMQGPAKTSRLIQRRRLSNQILMNRQPFLRCAAPHWAALDDPDLNKFVQYLALLIPFRTAVPLSDCLSQFSSCCHTPPPRHKSPRQRILPDGGAESAGSMMADESTRSDQPHVRNPHH
jgi:hypothetical protein